MQNEWSLRTEIIQISHRWQIPALAFLIGSLLGWGSAFVFPTNYRAEVPLYVTYNGDAIYRNPDDYKNWQISQLNDLTTTDAVVEETLRRLRDVDLYWEQIDNSQFRAMTRVFWRNTGRWRMVIEHPDRDRSALAVRVWSNVLIETYLNARESSIQQTSLDKELYSIAIAQTADRQRLVDIQGGLAALSNWNARLQTVEPEYVLSEIEYWHLWSILARISTFNPLWQSLLDSYPAHDSGIEEYTEWIDKTILALDEDKAFVENRLARLAEELEVTNQAYETAVENTGGLSADLDVGLQYFAPIEPEPIRQKGLVSLVGGILGILIWSILWLARPVVQQRKLS